MTGLRTWCVGMPVDPPRKGAGAAQIAGGWPVPKKCFSENIAAKMTVFTTGRTDRRARDLTLPYPSNAARNKYAFGRDRSAAVRIQDDGRREKRYAISVTYTRLRPVV